MSKRFFSLLVCLFATFSLSAFATDGVILINQASVNNAGGFPYKITQSGSYRLSGNLSVTTAGVDAIDINADNVVLDMNGFGISSVDTTCTGSPVTSCTSGGVGFLNGSAYGIRSGQSNITIRNGAVTGFPNGIGLAAGAGNLVEEVHASGNSIGISVTDGIVRRCTAILNLTGIGGNTSNFSENTSNRNHTGLVVFQSNYGNNTLSSNTTDVVLFGGGNTSQHNNNCSGTVC